MRELEMRLRRLENEVKARMEREQLMSRPLVIRRYVSERIADQAFDPVTGRGPLIIVFPGERPVDDPIAERDRPFIITGQRPPKST